MNKLYIGWSEVSITPDKKVSLVGQFAERISEYVEKPITATAMAISSGDEHMIMVSCDLVSVSTNLVAAVRKKFEDNNLGIIPEKIILNAIHTHTGPIYPREKCSVSAGGTKTLLEAFLTDDRKYVDNKKVTKSEEIITLEETFIFLVEKISEAVLKAWEKREESSFSNAFGRAAVGMCRRVTYSDGSARMWGETNTAAFVSLEGGSDTGIELLYTFDSRNKLTGIVVNLACPAQCVQHRLFISPDFWGEVKVLVRERFGQDIYILAQCSAAGDQAPIDLIRWVEPESDVNDPNITRKYSVKRKADPSMFDLKGMKLTGRRIAREIISVYEDGLDKPQSEADFVHHVEIINLPIRKVTLKEAAEAEKTIKNYLHDKKGDIDFYDAANLQAHLGILNRLNFQDTKNVYGAEIHIIKLGNVAIATNPFELFLDYGNQIKARSKAHQTFVVQLACGCEDYLPTKKAEEGGHYSGFVSSGLVGHEGGELLVSATLDQINNMFIKEEQHYDNKKHQHN